MPGSKPLGRDGTPLDLDPAVAEIEHAMMEMFNLATSRQVHAERQRRSGTKVTATQWEVLRRVDDLGPISVSKLAGLVARSVPVTSRALQDIERDRLVRRLPDPDDGRLMSFVATGKGRKVRARFHAAMLGEIVAVTGGWSSNDRADFAALLGRFAREIRGAAPKVEG